MNEQQWLDIMRGVLSDLQANLPKVSGNMVRNTKIISSWGNGEMIGELIIDVPYARFVNYGFENHPNSHKLARDYKIVETTIKNSLEARLEGVSYGN